MATYNTSSYDDAIKKYRDKMLEDANAEKKKTNTAYDAQAKQAYVSNVQNQNALKNQLTQAGIRGGASESSMLKQQTNYQNTQNAIASDRQSALQSIDKDANDRIFDYTTTTEAAKRAYIEGREAEDRAIEETKRQEGVQINENIRQEGVQQAETIRQEEAQKAENEKAWERQTFIDNIGQYDTVQKGQDAIAYIESLKETDPEAYNANAWKIDFIKNHIAGIEATEKDKAAEKESADEAFAKQSYIDNIYAYDTSEKVNNAINAIMETQTTDPEFFEKNKWKIDYLKGQLATVTATESEKAEAEAEANKQAYLDTIGRFNNVDEAQYAIDVIMEWKETNPTAYKNNEWKLNYLRARKAELEDDAKAEAEAKAEVSKQEYIDTIGRYDTVKKCQNQIDIIKGWEKTHPEWYKNHSWKIKYLQEQMAYIRAND